MIYSKYKNKRVTHDGMTFDSMKEAKFYLELKLLERTGAIQKVECQVRFILQQGFEKAGRKIQPIIYVADFLVTDRNGDLIVYDVKPFDKRTGKFLLTPEFKLKRKLFEKAFPELSITLA